MNKDDLDEYLRIIREEMKKGKGPLIDDPLLMESLKRIRYPSDQKVDSAHQSNVHRESSLNQEVESHKDKPFNPSFRNIQKAYFDILESHFGKIYTQMQKHKFSPKQMVINMAHSSTDFDIRDFDINQFFQDIRKFWESNHEIIYNYIQHLQTFKLVYGGDIFPSYQSNIPILGGLYLGTIILPDPILRVGLLCKIMPHDRKFYFLLENVLNILSYKGLSLAEVDPPILIIAPDPNLMESNHQQFLALMAERDTLSHFEVMLDHPFGTKKLLDSFLSNIQAAEELVSLLRSPEYLLFDINWDDPIGEQIRRYQKGVQERFRIKIAEEGIGKIIHPVILGRMLQINDVLLKSLKYTSSPFIDDPTLWQYLVWKYRHNVMRLGGTPSENDNLMISKTLLINGEKTLNLISHMPRSVLIALRKQGVMENFRAIIRESIQDIHHAELPNFHEIAKHAFTHIEMAFKKHEELICHLVSHHKKFYGEDLVSYMGSYNVSISAALTGHIPMSIISSSQKEKDLVSSKDPWKKEKALLKKGDQSKRLPVTLFFNQLKR